MPGRKYILAKCGACLATFATRQDSHARFCSNKCERGVRFTKLQQRRRELESTFSREHSAPSGCSWLAIASGNKRFCFSLVDDDVYVAASKLLWRLNTRGYAFSRLGERSLVLHRLVLNPPSGLEVDHVNRDQLDNRRSNLRTASHAQNMLNVPPSSRNTSGYRGVKPFYGKWAAQVNHDGVRYHLGVFDDPVEAAIARDQVVRELDGAFAQLNFPEEDYS